MSDYWKASCNKVQAPARAALKPGDLAFIRYRAGHDNAYKRVNVTRVTNANVFVADRIYDESIREMVDGERRFRISDGAEYGSMSESYHCRDELFAATAEMKTCVYAIEHRREQKRKRNSNIYTLRKWRYDQVSDETLQQVIDLLEADAEQKS